MAAATLEATTRDSRGKNEARRLRAAGKIPAVLYGGADGALALSVDPKVLSRILHSGTGVNTIIGLDVAGKGTTQVLVKEFLLDPIKHSMLHADFYRVQMDKAITVTVSIVAEGRAEGRQGPGRRGRLPGPRGRGRVSAGRHPGQPHHRHLRAADRPGRPPARNWRKAPSGRR